MKVDIELVKRLKELTGVGLTDAKKALEESKGNFDSALSAMRKKGLTKAEKRGEKEARAGVIATYNHDQRIGVLIEVNCETDFVARNEVFQAFVKDIAMQVAASNPLYVSKQDIDDKQLSKLKAEFKDQAKDSDKSPEVLEDIVNGQLKKYYSEHCLLEQPFIKNPDQTVNDYLKEYIAKLGENIVIRRFIRFALGEVA